MSKLSISPIIALFLCAVFTTPSTYALSEASERIAKAVVTGVLTGGSVGCLSHEAESLIVEDHPSFWRIPFWWAEGKATTELVDVIANAIGLSETAGSILGPVTKTDAVFRVTTRVCSWIIYIWRHLKSVETRDRNEMIEQLAYAAEHHELDTLAKRLLARHAKRRCKL